jgi:hypothetical protein
MVEYIKPREFKDFAANQGKLINLLNHRMTLLEVDVKWIKKIMSIQTALMTGMFLSLLGVLIKVII